ncbi:DNA glycosylase AlkZ-like family protein [Streptococcus ovuberis]|uniref:Winged helix DNA-binding domain-containing protein n=1 Tax=Streptococcus ovuberis TaxID=1936207 RepID=A0A7X6N022_9STRE|nr:crosslink repair DNA glycosylase YcaQ family protein [Streptococcus ovuberis]NKZ21021.1 winged helix DNA-binding domain-containing protein [Streptococcus ovuberis]
MVTKEEIIAQRFWNQGLVEQYKDLTKLLGDSLGIQSQYLNHGLFNIFTRLESSKPFESIQGDVILAWGQRQTYHFYDHDAWLTMTAYLADTPRWPDAYFAEKGIDGEAESDRLRQLVSEHPSRNQLPNYYGDSWADLFRWSALFIYNSKRGRLYQKWLPDDRLIVWEDNNYHIQTNMSRDLVISYFSFYEPATVADAAHFFGVKQSKITETDLAQLKLLTFEGRRYYFKTWKEDITIPDVLVLGKFDPLLVSYKYKDLLIDPVDQSSVWKKAGQISALILIKGQLKATWVFQIRGDTISFKVQGKQRITQKHQAAIRRQFKKYAEWMKKSVSSITFSFDD